MRQEEKFSFVISTKKILDCMKAASTRIWYPDNPKEMKNILSIWTFKQKRAAYVQLLKHKGKPLYPLCNTAAGRLLLGDALPNGQLDIRNLYVNAESPHEVGDEVNLFYSRIHANRWEKTFSLNSPSELE